MKNLTIIFVLIFLVSHGFAQSPDMFRHQVIVRDATNNLVAEQALGVQVTLMKGSAPGTIVYQETFSQNSNANGLLNLTIGSGSVVSGNFSNIDWADGPYYIETAIDPDNGTSYSIFSTSQFQSLPYAIYSNEAAFAEGADYNSLDNQPQTITGAQSDKIDFLTISNALNLDLLSNQVGLNNAKVTFPGFGTGAGTAYEIQWHKIGDDAFYLPGNVGMGVPNGSSFDGSVLGVGGAILYNGIPATTTPGLLYYDNNTGLFSYFDELENKQTIGRNIAYISNGFTGKYELIPPTPPITYKLLSLKTDNNVLTKGRVATGKGARPEHLTQNAMTVADTSIRIRFWDTSNSSSFPSTDWRMVFNDHADGGDDYFAIDDISAGTTPFKVMAGAPNQSLFIDENGLTGLGTDSPTEQLEVIGTVEASGYIGDASQLTGLPAGTVLIENTGSTTLNADTDANSSGDILFQTANTNKLVIASSGNIGIGNDTPSTLLDVNGTGTISGEALIQGNFQPAGQLQLGVFNEPSSTSGFVFNYDVTGKNVVFVDPSAADLTVVGLTTGIPGQKITFINKSATRLLKIFPGGSNIISATPENFPQYGSVTLVCEGYYWIVSDVIN
jgi:hypothetical protein